MIYHKQHYCSSRYMIMYLTCFMFPGGRNENTGKHDLPHVVMVLLRTDMFLLFAHFYLYRMKVNLLVLQILSWTSSWYFTFLL